MESLGSIWTRYNFSGNPHKGLWMGAGAVYTGRQAGFTGSNVDYFLDPFWDVNAVVGYDWKVKDMSWTASLNINNLTDDRNTPAYAWFRYPRRATFTLRTTF